MGKKKDVEMITYNIGTKILSVSLLALLLSQSSVVISSLSTMIEIIGWYLSLITLFLLTVLIFTFSVTFTQDGFLSNYFFFFKGKHFVWKGKGKKLTLVPANFLIFCSLNYAERSYMMFLVSFMVNNFSGVCRMVYKYQDTEDEGDRNTLRKWGKINESEEEYQDRLRLEQLKKRIVNMKDVTNSNSMKKKEKLQRLIIEMENKLENSEYWNKLL